MEHADSFTALVEMNRHVVAAFERRERRPWGIETEIMELTKQFGDLTRAILTYEGYYLADRDSSAHYAADDERIGDELADILYCLLRIADRYSVDLAAAHRRARGREWQLLEGSTPPPWQADSSCR